MQYIERSMPIMSVMENPIDLSVPKPNKMPWVIKNPEGQTYCSINPNFYSNPQLIATAFNVVPQPGYYPGYFAPPFVNIQRNPPSHPEMHPGDQTVTSGTSPVSNSPELVMNTPSPSPESLPENEQKNTLEENEKLLVEKEIESCEGKRRLSATSSTSTTSSCEDANNNEKKKIKEASSTQPIEEFCSRKYLEKSPGKSRRRSENSETPNSNSEKDVIVSPKREVISPELTRLVPSPVSSFTSDTDICDSTNKTRVTRPFKAITTGTIMDNLGANGPLGDFETFRQNILSRVNSTSKSTDHNMRRTGNSANMHVTDPTYWEKRKRNNEAAKRSRDARRRKEDEIAIRCAYLEQERLIMINEIKMLRNMLENNKLHSNNRFHPYSE